MSATGPNPRDYPAWPYDPHPPRDEHHWPDYTVPRHPPPPTPLHRPPGVPRAPTDQVWDDPYWYV